MKVFICEKQTVAVSIGAVLGKPIGNNRGYLEFATGEIITWASGHMYELEPPSFYTGQKGFSFKNLPCLPVKWARTPVPSKQSQLSVILSLVAKASVVVHAGDQGKEGQLIVDEILEEAGWKGQTLRLWLNATDESSVRKALGDLRDNADYKLTFKAALARQMCDWLFGMNLTPAITLAAHKGGFTDILSVGRVQTPALNIIVQRDLEIENFIPKDYFIIKGDFTHPNGAFQTKYRVPKELWGEDGSGVDEDGRVINRIFVDKIHQEVVSQVGTVTHLKTTRASENPAKLYDINEISIHANSKYGYTLDKTLEICQSLYDKQLTTYPRVECQVLPSSQFPEAPTILAHLSSLHPIASQANTTVQPGCFDDVEFSKHEHHAIIPTQQPANIGALSNDEKKIYELICLRYIAQFFPARLIDKTAIEVTVKNHVFYVNGNVQVSPGWHAVYNSIGGVEEEAEDDAASKLPGVQQGDKVNMTGMPVDSKKTTPPKRYNDASLLKAMINVHAFVTNPELKKRLKAIAGIGTGATRASIIKTLETRKYVDRKKKDIISTPVGRHLVTQVPANIKDPGMTALWDGYLENIQVGTVKQEEFVNAQADIIKQLVKKFETLTIKMPGSIAVKDCPKCGKLMRALKAKTGANAGKTFLACSGYPECKHAEFPEQKFVKDCPKCGKGMREMVAQKGERKGQKFLACSGYPDCTHAEPLPKKKVKACPKCGKDMHDKTVQKGEQAGKKFIGCSGYPECNHSEWPDSKKSGEGKSKLTSRNKMKAPA